MGCIVNGPGEMADADFGYVGGARDPRAIGPHSPQREREREREREPLPHP